MNAQRCAQAEYWRRRGSSDKENHGVSYVEYGNDVEGTAFCDVNSEDPLGRSSWNMRVRSQSAQRQSDAHVARGRGTLLATPVCSQ